MGRDELLRQKKEREEALKELNQKYKDPASIKYEMRSESGTVYHAEYLPGNDTLILSCGSEIKGELLKPLRDILNKLLDD